MGTVLKDILGPCEDGVGTVMEGFLGDNVGRKFGGILEECLEDIWRNACEDGMEPVARLQKMEWG